MQEMSRYGPEKTNPIAVAGLPVAGGASRGVWEPEKRLAASLRAGRNVQNEANLPGAEMGGNYCLEKGLGGGCVGQWP